MRVIPPMRVLTLAHEWGTQSFDCTLRGEQLLLALDSPAIAGEAAVLANDAVAGHSKRDRIGADCGRNRAHSGRPSYLARDLRVAARLAARDLAQRLPHALLEGGGAHVQREGGGQRVLGGLAGNEGDGL